MTQPSNTPNVQAAPDIRYGKNARLELAPWNGGVEPPADQFVFFCATDQVEIGSEKGKETINNFCTGGNDVEIGDGSEKPTLTTGDAFWTEKDKAMLILKAAYNAPDEENARVWYRFYPLGKGAGKPVFRGILDVSSWKMTAPSKGLIKMAHGLNVLGKPEEGTVGAGGAFVPLAAFSYDAASYFSAPAPQPIAGAALADNVAANLPDTQAAQAVTYSVTSTAQGDITVATAGTSSARTVDILNAAGDVLATGANGALLAAAPAGTYTVRVGGANASTGGTITADWMA